MKNKYLIRLDDACPTMDGAKWDAIENILDKNCIRPMAGIIPHNEDLEQNICPYDNNFWHKALAWQKKGWAIAMHGYDHCYISSERGINPLWNRSEFAGVSLEKQKEKIRKGIAILQSNGIYPKYFFAPSHTFDLNTLAALRECSNIRIISDTIANKPYKYKDFIFIPQVGGHCVNMPFNGIWTFCLHPSMMDDKSFTRLEKFLNENKHKFMAFQDINFDNVKAKNTISKLLSSAYFTYRKARGL